LVVAELTGTGHIAVYAVLLASGSAAIVLPTLQERKLDGAEALVVFAQVTVADVAAILAVPLVLQPSRAANAAVGGLVIAVCALIVFFVARSLRRRRWVHRLRKRSKRRGWALDLRLSLAVLFALAWIAQQTGTSVLLGGFGMGLVVAGIGGPKRLSTQVRGVADTLTPDVAERLLAELTSRLVAVERDLVHFPISYSFSAGDPRFSLPVAAPYLLRIARRGMNEAQPTIVRFRARLLMQAIDDLAKTTATQFHGPGATTPEELLSG
jgi:hypothetical protein